MKKILFIICCCISIAAFSQEPKELNFWGAPITNDSITVGETLIKSANLQNTSITLNIVGGALIGVGSAFFPPLMIVGGAVCVTSMVCNIAAWHKIKKAGRKLKRLKI